mmetsp:Transcript_37159/g.75801  ORF Transcript_37159/g.75801 Transcript_37159/m.75801 type:complete len:417 (+) Transcript_37159:1395-2645(+)
MPSSSESLASASSTLIGLYSTEATPSSAGRVGIPDSFSSDDKSTFDSCSPSSSSSSSSSLFTRTLISSKHPSTSSNSSARKSSSTPIEASTLSGTISSSGISIEASITTCSISSLYSASAPSSVASNDSSPTSSLSASAGTSSAASSVYSPSLSLSLSVGASLTATDFFSSSDADSVSLSAPSTDSSVGSSSTSSFSASAGTSSATSTVYSPSLSLLVESSVIVIDFSSSDADSVSLSAPSSVASNDSSSTPFSASTGTSSVDSTVYSPSLSFSTGASIIVIDFSSSDAGSTSVSTLPTAYFACTSSTSSSSIGGSFNDSSTSIDDPMLSGTISSLGISTDALIDGSGDVPMTSGGVSSSFAASSEVSWVVLFVPRLFRFLFLMVRFISSLGISIDTCDSSMASDVSSRLSTSTAS